MGEMRKGSFAGFTMALMAFFLLSIMVNILPVEAEQFIPLVDTMPTEQVKPGMKGLAYTVVRGNRLVSFPVEVISILPRKGIPQNLIMIRASGPVIEETGGIAAGMSGSPVYIENKLIGAIGYGWNFTEHDLGLVTPIQDMSAIWDHPEKIPSMGPPPSFKSPGSPGKGEDVPDSEDLGDMGSVELMEQNYGSPRTTFFADGISSRAAERISVNLGKEISLVGGSAVGELSVEYNPSLRPGEAVGVMLAWGDVSMGATGTLTSLSKDGRFLAFAHPFLNRGYGSYPLTRSWIHNVVPSIQAPFKVGSPLSIIGSVTQDRAQAIGGRIGLFLPSVDASVKLKDIDNERTTFKRFHMAQDPFLISEILPDVALGIIDESWGRKGEGTVRINIEIEGRGLEDGWERTNYFFSDKDLAKESLKEVKELTQVLSLNPFREIMPLGIHLDMEITSRPKVLFIEGLSINKKEARPGDEILVEVLLRPYRKAQVKKEFKLSIPREMIGPSEVIVRGGGIAPLEQESIAQGLETISSFNELLQEMSAQETNNEVIIELLGGTPPGLEGPDLEEEDELLSQVKKRRIEEGTLKIFKSDYFVEGLLRETIKVLPSNG